MTIYDNLKIYFKDTLKVRIFDILSRPSLSARGDARGSAVATLHKEQRS